MTGFDNPVVDNTGNLQITSIQSPGFQLGPPVVGWQINKNGQATFQSVTIGTGVQKIYTQATPPTSPNVNDVWIQTANNNLYSVWNGTSWQAVPWGTNAIANGAVGTAQIANNAVGTGQIANNAVGSGQIANNAVGSPQIANGAVNTPQLANGAVGTVQISNGAITAPLLAAGIVYAGIVDGTTIQAQSFIGGNYYGYNTPSAALDALIVSLVPGTANVADSVGNIALPGLTTYGGTSGNWTAACLRKGGVLSYYVMTSTDMNGTWTYAGQLAPTLSKVKTAGQNIVSTTAAQVTFDSGINAATVAAGISYRLRGLIRIHMGGTASSAGIQFNGPAMTFSSIGIIGMLANANLTSGDYFWLTSINTNFAAGWAANAQTAYLIDGVFVPSANGNVQLLAYQGTSGAVWTLDAGTYLDFIPVVQG